MVTSTSPNCLDAGFEFRRLQTIMCPKIAFDNLQSIAFETIVNDCSDPENEMPDLDNADLEKSIIEIAEEEFLTPANTRTY